MRPSGWARVSPPGCRRELCANPSTVKTLEDHALLYADPAMAFAFDFLDGERGQWADAPRRGTAEALSTILDHFRTKGQDALYVNLTPVMSLLKLDQDRRSSSTA